MSNGISPICECCCLIILTLRNFLYHNKRLQSTRANTHRVGFGGVGSVSLFNPTDRDSISIFDTTPTPSTSTLIKGQGRSEATKLSKPFSHRQGKEITLPASRLSETPTPNLQKPSFQEYICLCYLSSKRGETFFCQDL